jgi:hypothetical protein
MQTEFWPVKSWATEWRDGRTWHLIAPISDAELTCFEIGKYGDTNAYLTTHEAAFVYKIDQNIELAEWVKSRITHDSTKQFENPYCCVIQVKEESKIIKKYLLHDFFINRFSCDVEKYTFSFNIIFKDVTFI